MKISSIDISRFTKEDIKDLVKIHGEKQVNAAVEHVKRQSRDTHPEGFFDSGGRFYIEEGCDCCISVRSPSRSHPYSYMVHGRTLPHCIELFKADEKRTGEALRGVKRIAKANDYTKGEIA